MLGRPKARRPPWGAAQYAQRQAWGYHDDELGGAVARRGGAGQRRRRKQESLARLQPDAGLHPAVSELDRAGPALGAGTEDVHAELGSVLGSHQFSARD